MSKKLEIKQIAEELALSSTTVSRAQMSFENFNNRRKI